MGGSREKFSAFSKFSFEYLNFISEQIYFKFYTEGSVVKSNLGFKST